MRNRRFTTTAEVDAMTVTGMLTKADTSTHTKWQRRWFVLRGRWLSYYRTNTSTSVSGRVVLDSESTIEMSDLRPNAFKLITNKRTLHAQADSSDDLAKWMSSIGNAIKIEQELASGTLVDSEDDLDFVENTKRPTTRKLASDYSDIVRASLSRGNTFKLRDVISKKNNSTTNTIHEATRTPRRHRPLWQPMVGLFSQLVDHFTSPSPHKHVSKTSTNTSNVKTLTSTTKQEKMSWQIGESLSSISVGTLPPVVNACRVYLSAKNRFETEGIFRVPGHVQIVSSIRNSLLKNEISVGDVEAFSKLVSEKNIDDKNDEKSNVYNVATLMKSCLADLPLPVVPLKCYERLLQIHGECTTREARLEAVRGIMRDRDLISESHVQCLFSILEFLQDVSKKSQVNRMAPSQLAICFAPTLLRPPQHSTNPVKIMRDMCAGIGVVEILIENARDSMLRGGSDHDDDYEKRTNISGLVMSRAKLRRGRRRPSVIKSCRIRSMTIGNNKKNTFMSRSRRNALLALGSDEEETRRRRESSSDRKFFVTHAFIRCTSARSPVSLKGNERRRVLLDTHARTLRIVSLEGQLCVKNLIDVHRHESTSEIDAASSNTTNWHTLTLVLSPGKKEPSTTTKKEHENNEDSRLLHFSAPPADAGRWATSLSAIARHGQYLSTSSSSSTTSSSRPLQRIDTNVNVGVQQQPEKNNTIQENSQQQQDDETMIMHGFMYLLSAQKEWRRVHVTLTDTMLEWVLCAKSEDMKSSTGIALYLENVRVGPTFVGTTGSCFTLSASNPSMMMTTTNPLPLVVRMSRSKGTLWNTLLRSCSVTSEISESVKAVSEMAARQRRRRRRRRRSSVVNHAVAAQFQNGSFRNNNNKLRRFPSDRKSLHMSVKYNVEWECDGNDVRCACCSVRFTFFRRRHHCRLCGNLVCDACSQSRLPTQFSGTLERACDECVSHKTKENSSNESDGAKMNGQATRERKNVSDFLQLIKHYESQTQQHRRALSSMAVHFSEVDQSLT